MARRRTTRGGKAKGVRVDRKYVGSLLKAPDDELYAGIGALLRGQAVSRGVALKGPVVAPAEAGKGWVEGFEGQFRGSSANIGGTARRWELMETRSGSWSRIYSRWWQVL